MDYEKLFRILCFLEKRVTDIELSDTVNTSAELINISKPNYAAMIADGIPKRPTIYEIMDDETQGNNVTMYIWLANNHRYLLQTAIDN